VTTRQSAILAAVVGVAYAATLVVTQDAVAPGLVGGALAGVLVFLLIRRVQEHNAMRRRRAEGRDRAGGP